MTFANDKQQLQPLWNHICSKHTIQENKHSPKVSVRGTWLSLCFWWQLAPAIFLSLQKDKQFKNLMCVTLVSNNKTLPSRCHENPNEEDDYHHINYSTVVFT